MEWSLRYAKTALEEEDGEIEVRQLFDLDEFEQGPAIQGFRELDLVGRIAADVGRSRPDLSRAVSADGTVTVLFTDIEGSTQITEALGDAEWIHVLRAHNAIVRDQVAAHGGIEVKSQGDGFMLAFATAEDALSCAIEIQRALVQPLSDGHRLRVRIGLHTLADPRGGRLLREGRGPRRADRGGGTRRGDPGLATRPRAGATLRALLVRRSHRRRAQGPLRHDRDETIITCM